MIIIDTSGIQYDRLTLEFSDFEVRKKVWNIHSLSEVELQDLVVKDRNVIVYIKNPSEEVKRLAIEKFPDYVPFILSDLSFELQKLCVEKISDFKSNFKNNVFIGLPACIKDQGLLDYWKKLVSIESVIG